MVLSTWPSTVLRLVSKADRMSWCGRRGPQRRQLPFVLLRVAAP